MLVASTSVDRLQLHYSRRQLFGERPHRGLARLRVAVRRRAVFVLPQGEVDRAAAVLHDARATTAVGASYSGVNRSSTCKLHQDEVGAENKSDRYFEKLNDQFC